MLRRNLTILALFFICALGLRAQYDPSFSHYFAMATAYNPAAAGKQDKINAVIAYNMSMVGFEHNPRTMYLAGDMPFNALGAYHGVGLQMINDDIGVFSHKQFSGLYALKQKLSGGILSIGIQPTMLSESLNGSKVELEEKSDPAFSTSDVTGSAFDLSFGLYYQRKNWYAGASVQHLLAPTVELGESNDLAVSRTYYLTGGCNIRLRNPFLTIQPSLMGRFDGVAYRVDITSRITYTYEKRLMYAGLGYSPTNSFTVYLGGSFHGIMLGYSYEMYTSAIPLKNGSHELYVGYQTDVNLFKKGRNRHQSVRLL
ncbi:MAG: type IX secretion system membrane protein PorP/SprF [Prevotella sp.]|nr:type IX secretion system membrane protein PorP/SprF [Prevotella sp.]MBR3480376.1 type IX secretion system membrane protein PorP/SprF [Prevotella sp.]MBR6189463.1 type IX secretion system membrane protein PorP/SprF [Prevotella sp.]